jgi:hypothetical protein
MFYVGQVVVVYLHKQDVESFCLSIYTQNGATQGKAQPESYCSIQYGGVT